MCLVFAYSIVTALGVLMTIAFAAIFHPFSAPDVPMTDVPAYTMTVPFHPLLNLLVWPLFGWWYARGLPSGSDGEVEAIRLGGFWLGSTVVVDLVGWVLVPHPWRMSAYDFYVGYQPWISLIYIAIFLSPMIAFWAKRRIRNPAA